MFSLDVFYYTSKPAAECSSHGDNWIAKPTPFGKILIMVSITAGGLAAMFWCDPGVQALLHHLPFWVKYGLMTFPLLVACYSVMFPILEGEKTQIITIAALFGFAVFQLAQTVQKLFI